MSAPLLSVAGLTVEHRSRLPRTTLRAVDEVDLTIGPGETLGLVGESGAGKTTLGRAILGLVAPSAGTIRFAGADLGALSARRRRQLGSAIQAVFQDPFSSLNPARTVGQTLVESLWVDRDLTRAAKRSRVDDVLRRVGLEGAAGHYPRQFSGGQRQRIAIARALVGEPRLVVCDEPVSALDLSVQAQILNLFRELQAELGVSYLFVSHDLAVVRNVSHRIAVMKGGKIVESGAAEQIYEAPSHPYTRSLLEAGLTLARPREVSSFAT